MIARVFNAGRFATPSAEILD